MATSSTSPSASRKPSALIPPPAHPHSSSKPAATIATPLTPPAQAATPSPSNTPFKPAIPQQISINSPQPHSRSMAAPSPMRRQSAFLTLAAPGETGSLSANTDFIVETTQPTVTGVDSTTTDGTYGIGDVINSRRPQKPFSLTPPPVHSPSSSRPVALIDTPLTAPVPAAPHSLSNTPFKQATTPLISISFPQQHSPSMAAPSPIP